MLSSSSSRRGRSVFYEDEGSSDISDARNKKASTWEAFSAIFRFFSLRSSPRRTGAKVKKETENSSIHACVTLYGLKQ
ncbi:hypothetical protein NG99_16060 [Erwinia typographi]|uniref:Uncharacterized protein n=1 Tax=Erwinia typographi TaxID=371042 RepID=A0A0A3YY79_9GAMM|nr:hypothetical protein NG99_16060 [Erwinia typographi]